MNKRHMTLIIAMAAIPLKTCAMVRLMASLLSVC